MAPGSTLYRRDAIWGLGGVLLAATVLIGSAEWAPRPADALVRNSIRLALIWYGLALLGFLNLGPSDWAGRTFRGQAVRWCWTWACLTYVVHVGLAFQYVHHWSHAAAFEHVRQGSGFGHGIFVSYLFTLLWCLDVAFWWLNPDAYAKRSRGIDRLLHTFMLFIVFNGALVFAAGPVRWVSLSGFLILGVMLLLRRATPVSANTSPAD